jgi:predicted Zn-ribbon and HTH transcriptional regulator
MEDNYDPSILEWVNANYLRTFIYNDAHVNVLKEALPSQKDHRSKGIERKIRNPKCKKYNYEDSTRLVKKKSKNCAFYRVKGRVITKCP